MPRSSHLIASTRKAIRDSPPEIFNWYLFFCNAIISFSGVAKGFDEGNIASLVVMKSFKEKFGLASQSTTEYANTKGWIVSIATAGAVFGCLSCSWLNTKLGRKLTLQLYTVIYIAGILGQTFSGGSLAALYVSRVIAGFGIGGTTVVPSVYLSEIAPKSIRGLITVQYASCQQLGVVFGFFINYGVSEHYSNNIQWQLPTAMQVIPALIWGLGIFFVPESPRWLLAANRPSEGAKNLSRIRQLPEDHPLVAAELHAMETQLLLEAETTAGSTQLELLKETLGTPENRRRFVLMFCCHTFSQWSGANAITQYSPTIFGYLGVPTGSITFLTTGIYGIVKFVATLSFGLFIVDFIGRRRSLITGICLQICTLAFIGAYLGATTGLSAAQIAQSPTLRHTSTASIVAIFLHAVGWSIGWFSAPYLVNSEIFPTRIRSFNMSIFMALHWAFYFGCSRAMPSLLVATHRYGAFAFFASICCLSLVFVFFCMPETAGRSLESMDSLFQRPLYTIWKVAYPTDDEVSDVVADQYKSSDGYDTRHLEEAKVKVEQKE